MAINFDSLPKENPFALPEPGLYIGHIAEATMKTGKDTSKPDYLNMRIDLYDKDGNKKGNIFDILSESDSSIVQYKISRFVRACGIPLTGSIELKDLAKIVAGKRIALDISIDKKQDQPRAQVDLFTREAYYLESEFNDLYRSLHPEETDIVDSFVPDSTGEGEVVFNAPDGGAPAPSNANY